MRRMTRWGWFILAWLVGGTPLVEGAFAQGPGWIELKWGATTKSPAAPAVSARKRAGYRANSRRQSYEGIWGASNQACRDQDGVDRMEITGRRFFWYETRCQTGNIEAERHRSWTMRVSSQGEGQRYRARPRLSLLSRNKLIVDDAPVGPTRRQIYVRCVGLENSHWRRAGRQAPKNRR